MKTQVETITWFPTQSPGRPDAEITVLICSEEEGVLSGYWDDEENSWMDCTGAVVQGVQFWAIAEGPQI